MAELCCLSRWGLAWHFSGRSKVVLLLLSKSISIRILATPKSPAAMVWNFTPDQLQDPDEVIECWGKKCRGCSRETVLTALGWAPAGIYQTLLSIVQHPQGEERENRPTDTMAKADTVSVAPITKKKQWKRKSTGLVRDEEASNSLLHPTGEE